MFNLSTNYYEQSSQVFSEGVNSPLRLFSEVETPPLFIDSARGSEIKDVDGNHYIDFINGLGSLILGHSHPEVQKGVADQIQQGSIYCCNCGLELELGREIKNSSSFIDKLRFTCSGTEAVMGAIRVARSFSRKEKIVRFSGGYHGHSDLVLCRSEKKEKDYISRGITSSMQSSILTCPWGDWNTLESLANSDSNIAAVIIEPVASNMGLKVPTLTFLENVRRICDQHSIVLIFDEVVTGFRFCYGSVSNLFGISPDLVTFGKIIGGGMSIGCFGGIEKIMKVVEDNTGYFQGGTFSANPISMVAGKITLGLLKETDAYQVLESRGELFASSIEEMNRQLDGTITVKLERLGSAISILPCVGEKPLDNWEHVFSKLHLYLVKHGYLLAPSIDEPIFISTAHSEGAITGLVDNISEFFRGYYKTRSFSQGNSGTKSGLERESEKIVSSPFQTTSY